MSAGDYINNAVYETDKGAFVKIRVQPETLTLTLNSVVNAQATGTIDNTYPSAKVSGGRRTIGINARKVRVKFTGALPPGYSGGKDTISLPVLTPAVFNGYGDGQTGTYTLNGTDYDVEFVGVTAEKVK